MDLLDSMVGTSVPDVRAALLSVLAGFILSHLVAAVYAWTHRGLSYSRSFVHALILGGVVASMLMLAIGSNLVWGIGIVGTLAIIRFRTNLRDPRDMVFVFAALAAGIAAGVRAYAAGTVGTLIFCAAALYLNSIGFGARNSFDGLLRFTLPISGDAAGGIAPLLKAHCSKTVLASLQQVALDDLTEYAYQIRFRRDNSREALVEDLERVPGLANLSLLLQESQVDM